jgi:8-oxo-dGTP pyrophosphatase MutT (NUDIX family)
MVAGWQGRSGGDQTIPRPERWRLGDRPEWMQTDSDRVSRRDQVLDTVIAGGPARDAVAFDGARVSAVLVGLHEGDDGAEVILTRRSRQLRHHRGEISFPGGRLDPGEHVIDAALREAHGEIGLAPDAVEVVGELDHVVTVVSNSYIVPVVARIDRLPPWRLNPAEVDRVLRVPLAEFLRLDTYRPEWWVLPTGEFLVHFFELEDETVWGATGRMLHGLLARVLDPTAQASGADPGL